uniref:Integrase, catalytic region, zinc finger, CCHC-type, peptidase aspartic, catalytic n=1 Tax=Tanacetum cinerariifolium TaxID=118510 RepID=A0A6L2JV25_TANCI|nr:integrase, catalytic region, zinc finger, CCHC-type, peptidase aspartic, catalytic [Tanacetum cinerariifolium]
MKRKLKKPNSPSKQRTIIIEEEEEPEPAKKATSFKKPATKRQFAEKYYSSGLLERTIRRENILQSIDEGLFKMGKFRETLTEGAEDALHLGPEWDRVVADLTPKEKERYKSDIRAMNILLQGLPIDIYTLINHYNDAKYIWDNLKMLLKGSDLTKDKRESQLYDDFEHFCQEQRRNHS